MQKNTLFVLGDSIGRGILFNEKLNRYSLCRNTFDTALKSVGVRVFNFAKMGMTSQNALSLMDRCEESENAVAANASANISTPTKALNFLNELFFIAFFLQ